MTREVSLDTVSQGGVGGGDSPSKCWTQEGESLPQLAAARGQRCRRRGVLAKVLGLEPQDPRFNSRSASEEMGTSVTYLPGEPHMQVGL